jgi:hypothetical protein
MEECPSEPPTVAAIELDRRCIRREDAVFHSRERLFQPPLARADAGLPHIPGFREAPINHPAILRLSEHSDDFRVPYSDPKGMPVLLIDRKRWRCPKAAINLIHYCLDDRANGIVLLGLWSSYEHVDHLLTNIGVNNRNAL